MTARECLGEAQRAGGAFQRAINLFVDEFRRSGPTTRRALVQDALPTAGPLEGLVAAVVSALCREVRMETPDWVGHVASPEPFFPYPA